MRGDLQISVLEQSGNVSFITAPGEPNLLLVLDATAVAELTILCRRAHEALAALAESSVPPEVSTLLSRLSKVLQQYSAVQNKFFAGPSGAVEIDNVERELRELQQKLNNFHG